MPPELVKAAMVSSPAVASSMRPVIQLPATEVVVSSLMGSLETSPVTVARTSDMPSFTASQAA